MRTRFAPSPTGDLHLGSAMTALAAWWLARRGAGGATVLRVEDLDVPRVVAGSEGRQRDDLAWLGLDWDEQPGTEGPFAPYRQSERFAYYTEALDDLAAQGRTYLCDCSRAEIARVASAPHEGEEVVYPRTCRDKDPSRPMRRPPATRLKVEVSDDVPFVDGIVGPVGGETLHAGGDFVLRRADGVFAYQLAVAVDDLAMGITDIARGEDLLTSTPRQLLLMHLWRERGALPWASRPDQPLPRYFHLPLVRAADGTRLAKRSPGATLRELREAGMPPAAIVGGLAHGLGLVPEPGLWTAEALLAETGMEATLRPAPWKIPPVRDWPRATS